MSNEATVQLTDDHQEIRKLATDFENAGENATKTKDGTIA